MNILVRFLPILLLTYGCHSPDTHSENQRASDNTNLQSLVDTLIMLSVPAYDEDSVCSLIATDKYSYIAWRFHVFDKELDTTFFTTIDTICATGYVQDSTHDGKVNLEVWRFNDNQKAEMALKLLSLIENITFPFKPPTFWNWIKQENMIIFFYSLELEPSSPFYTLVKNNYKKNDTYNCCFKLIY